MSEAAGNLLVSVIMPAFNSAKYIRKSIQSVIDQTWPHWELVIVDDGSGDETREIISGFCEKDPRIICLINEENKGLGFSTNKALQHAQGTFAAKLDSDDIALPGWLEARVAYLIANPGVAGVSGSRILISQDDQVTRYLQEACSAKVIKWKLLFGNPVAHPGIVFRRGSWHYKAYRYLEDWELWSSMIVTGDLVMLKDHYIKYRIHAGNTSSKLGNQKQSLQPIVADIISQQTRRYFNVEIDAEILWYLYRDRAPFTGAKAMGESAIRTLTHLFDLYLAKSNHLDNVTYRNLTVAFWDGICHIMRCAPIGLPLLWTTFVKYPLSVRMLGDVKTRYTLQKLIYLAAKNVIQ